MVILQTKILTFRGSITLFDLMLGMLMPTNSLGNDLQNQSLSFS